jgi:hypothetical protein
VNELIRILHTYERALGRESNLVNLAKSAVFITRNMSQATKEYLFCILGVIRVGVLVYIIGYCS